MKRVWFVGCVTLPNDIAEAGLDSEDGYEIVAYALRKDDSMKTGDLDIKATMSHDPRRRKLPARARGRW